MPASSRLRTRAAAFAAVLALPAALWGALPSSPDAAPGAGDLRSRVDAARSHERSLSADVATFTALEAKLERDVTVIEGRLAEVSAELEVRRAQLARTADALARQRARLAALRARLGRSRRVLARRLRSTYESGRPDAITVVLTSRGFTDLLERGEFLRRINDQDTRTIRDVRSARDAARREAARLAGLESDERRAAAAVQAQRSALAAMREGLAARRASAARARAARLAALRSARGDRAHLEHELAALEAEQSSGAATSGSFGSWAIPWAIVQCESGGQNLPPNGAGASGYYQILPSTWSQFGGAGPAAYLAGKAEQDRVAARIYAGGAGVSNWECAGLVRSG